MRCCASPRARLVADGERRQLTPEHRFKTRAEMAALFADLPEALAATVEIAERCAFRPRTLAPILPRFYRGGERATAPKPRPATKRWSCAAGGGRPGAAARRARRRAGPHRRGVSGAARLRARRHRADEISGLLPDRRRFHPMGEGAGHSGRARPRLGRRLARRLCADHHRPRSDPLRPAVRALPQSGARVDAGLRHRLLPGPPRRGDPLRAGAIRPRPRRADHHLRHLAGARRAARRRPRACRCPTARSTSCASSCRRIRRTRSRSSAPSTTSRGCRPSATAIRWSRAPSTSRRSSKGCTATPRPMPPASSSATGRWPSWCRSIAIRNR